MAVEIKTNEPDTVFAAAQLAGAATPQFDNRPSAAVENSHRTLIASTPVLEAGQNAIKLVQGPAFQPPAPSLGNPMKP